MNSDYFFSLDQPLHDLPADSQVRATNLKGFSDLVSSMGGDAQHILEWHEIDPEQAQSENCFVDCQSFVNLYEFCASKFNDPFFGFHLAQGQSADVYGCIAALCRAAPDVRTAINCLNNYIPVLHSSESVLELVEGNSVAELRWSQHSNLGVNDQANCQGLLLNFKVLQMVGGEHFQPSYITLPPEVFKHVTPEIEKLVRCEIRKASDNGCIAFSSHFLNQTVAGFNQPLFQLLDGYMSRLKLVRKQSLADEITRYVTSTIGAGDVSIEDCADKLNISVRTLQTRLKAQGDSFSGLLATLRLDRAKKALRRCDLSIAEVADSLGYSERTSFGRAFKRWTGLSPQQYRQQFLN